ncbi:MAG: anaerobic ribonucleoside-triphosphate reductase activating protein [Muribaculaceae bacterium]|nr:anaerobic ribonucleoside-triphosphate reductase activating protein [Muribaculaceae bacterium]
MEENPVFNVMEIFRGTTVDGPGFRTSIYLAGCSHGCPGCHNPQSHDPRAGHEMSLKEIMAIVREEDFNVTISGGDPLFNPLNLKLLVEAIKKDRRNIWIYTGYVWEDIISNSALLSAIREADVLVDGLYISELRDPDLPFRGSSNQRIIDIQKSLISNEIVLY